MGEGTPSPPADLDAVKHRLGKVGVWLMPQVGAEDERRVAVAVEQLGYGTLWVGEGPRSREAFTHAAVLLSWTERIQVATGIASVWARDAVAAANAANTLAEAWPHRFVLGLGISHASMTGERGHEYGRPVSTMRAYLDAMDAAVFEPPLAESPPRVLAALRRRMLELAGSRAQGAHTYFVTPEHTARAREVLGAGPILAAEQAVVVDTDRERARAAAREYAAPYLALPNYVNHLRELGFAEEDLGGGDALIDALVPWGDPDTVVERVRAHLDAGADHVCVQPIAPTIEQQAEHLRLLAPGLTT